VGGQATQPAPLHTVKMTRYRMFRR